jgi:PAS domain S-box-containing protein
MQDVFYRTDAKGNLVLVSPSGAKLLGYADIGEALGRPARDYYAEPAERETFLADLKKYGSVANAEVTLQRKDGSFVTVSTSSHVRYDADGNYAGVEGIFHDITRLRQVQEDLRESEEQYRVLVSHIQDGAFLSQDGILIYCNQAFADMVGYAIGEVTGMPVPDLIAPEDREMVMERQRARLAGKTLQESYGFRLLHRDGTTRIPVMMSVGTGTYRNRPAVIGTLRDRRKDCGLPGP